MGILDYTWNDVKREKLMTFIKDREEILGLLEQDYNTPIPKYKEYDHLTETYRKALGLKVVGIDEEVSIGYQALDDLINKYVR